MEAALNIRNTSKYWTTRREEKNNVNQAKRIILDDLVLKF